MARIRSVHPGLFTDEAFAALTDAAQVFLIGLWTEADDQGIFEWKPLTLRMRLRPAKDGDVTVLLSELADANCITSYEHDGKQYGLIRNFRKYQRPKKPNSVYFMPAGFRKYVGLSAPSGEPETIKTVPSGELASVKADPVPQKGEIAPQMEDGGKDGEEGSSVSNDTGVPPAASPPKPQPPDEPVADLSIPAAFDRTDVEAIKKQCYTIARHQLKRPGAPTELMKLNMSWLEILDTLTEAASATDPPSFFAKLLENKRNGVRPMTGGSGPPKIQRAVRPHT